MAELLVGFVLVIINWTVFGWIWFKLTELFEPETKPVTKPEPENEGKTGENRIKHLMRKPENPAALSSIAYPMDKDTEKSKVCHSPATMKITEAYVQKLENDHLFYKLQIDQFQHKFQNLSVIIQGFEEMDQDNQRLTEEVESLQKTVSEYDLERQTYQSLKQENAELHKKLERKLIKKTLQALSPKPLLLVNKDTEVLRSNCTSVNLDQPNVRRLIPSESDQSASLNSTTSLRETASRWESNFLTPESCLQRELKALNEDYHKNLELKTAELNQLKDENLMLKSNLELSIDTVTSKLHLLDHLKVETYELNQKLKRISLKNDELTMKLAASREIASKWEEDCLAMESKRTQDINELKASFEKQEEIRRAKELKLSKDNNGLIQLVQQLQAENGRAFEARDAAILSAEESTKLADEQAAVNGLLHANIVQLKAELSTSESQMDELRKENSVLQEKASAWYSTQSQLLQEIAGLKTVLKTENEVLSSKMSELDRIKDENNLLMANLDSVKESLAEKLTNIDQLTPHILELENENSLLELKNKDMKKVIADSHTRIEELQKTNEQLWETREAAMLSAQKSEKLAEEQVAALSEALSALQEAVTHAKDAATAENTGNDLRTTEATKTDAEHTVHADGTWIERWLIKHGFKTRKPRQESEFTKLLESTGFLMVERAKDLQEQAENIKVKGKELKKQAKKLSRQ